MASWQTFIQRVGANVRGTRASMAGPIPQPPVVLPPLPLWETTPALEPDLTPTGDTFCVCCLMVWEEYGDWHGVRPAGEPDFCEHHFERIRAAFPHPDECQIVLFRLALHGASRSQG